MDIVSFLQSSANPRLLASGDTLTTQIDTPDALICLADGWINATRFDDNGATSIARRLGPGTLLGLEALIGAGIHYGEIEALSECRLLVVPRTAAIKLLQQHPPFMLYALDLMHRRNADLQIRLHEAHNEPVWRRVCLELKRLQEATAAMVAIVTQTELAERIGANRETVTRVIKRLVELGIVHRRGQRYKVIFPLPAAEKIRL
ncbi:Crp/Fnr family transcriptional regulator [Gammaproteobacteria bacterium]|nr:Crp/Fnr family transcriptional regulator [Gammaproteobacteria bacterium]